MPAALILAAGASARFDDGPKALALVDGVPVLRRLIECSRAAGEDPIVVVAGSRAELLRPVVRQAGAEFIVHPGWEAGRTGSIQAGVRHLAGTGDVLIWPVDHPFVRLDTLLALDRSLRRDLVAAWAVPTFHRHGGHPVLVRPAAGGEILTLGPDEPLRTVSSRLGPQLLRVPVDDPGVVANTDTKEAFASALSDWRSRGG